MDRNLKLLRQLFRIGLPAYLLLLPVLMLYGSFHPWSPAQQALSRYAGQTALMIGFTFSAKFDRPMFDSDAPTHTRKYESRSYVLWPSLANTPKVVSVSQLNEQPPQTSESTLAFFAWVGWIVVCVVGTWWFWFRSEPADAA